MFAVIRTGGKQYRVVNGDLIEVERINEDPGARIALSEVLMIGDGSATRIGTPTVAGAAVTAEIVAQTRAPKILVFKKKRRKNYRRKRGHRQDRTVLRITDISVAA